MFNPLLKHLGIVHICTYKINIFPFKNTHSTFLCHEVLGTNGKFQQKLGHCTEHTTTPGQ
uniref:Uncharacterized protein n=1 Tax=Anguilla anguilla TaxID=7936 RepID=A0A0E9XBM5_ANGAN